MLCCGRDLSRSLINPNQLPLAGILVHDNPATAREEEFGLITDNLYIPFQTAGATIYFESFAPTYDEVNELVHQIIGPDAWDPLTVRLWDCPLAGTTAVEIAALQTGRPPHD